MSEIQRKLSNVRRVLAHEGLSGVVFRGVDWFSWATGGGSSSVIMTSESGVAEVLVTETGAWVVTTKPEDPRLKEEEVPGDFEVVVFPWQESAALSKFSKEKSRGGKLASDRPKADEVALSPAFAMLKRILSHEEIVRYRKVSALAAEAMTDVMMRAEPTWTEHELAGSGAEACWSRGLEPTLVLLAGAERGQRHRHPISKSNRLGRSAMMVFCARGFGLYANFTRFVYFEKPTSEQISAYHDLLKVESAAFRATTPGTSIRDVYSAIEKAYADIGRPNEINLHHQGGPCGYLSRDLVATPESPKSEVVKENMAFAWNPSLPGAKVEDTVLCAANGIEILTVDKRWPTIEVDGRQRPDLLVRA